jgi:hypothetical protein
MAIKMNPFGVGMSGTTIGTYRRTCACCRIVFAWTGMENDTTTKRCPPCIDHDPSSLEAEVDMLREHIERLEELLDTARTLARSAHAEINGHKEDVAEAKRQTAAALDSRNGWRAIVSTLKEAHSTYRDAKGTCTCGITDCPVSSALVEADRLNRGWGSWRD